MRVSGVLLVVLVVGHLLTIAVLEDGVHRVGFAFVAGRWAGPFWRGWDLTMLWLAQLHGAYGLRVVIDDYASRENTRFWLRMLLGVVTVLVLVTGTFVIVTFDPLIT